MAASIDSPSERVMASVWSASQSQKSIENYALFTCLKIVVLLMCARLLAGLTVGYAAPLRAFVYPGMFVTGALLTAQAGFRLPTQILGLISIWQIGAVGTYFWSVACFHVGAGFPMADRYLAEIDQTFGFRWPDYLHFFNAHPWINEFVYPAYMSIEWQPFVLCAALLITCKAEEAFKFELAFTVALLLTFFLAVFVPAYGAYHYFGIKAYMHANIPYLETADETAAALDWLRSANPVGGLPAYRGGLVAFPSFHTAAAILFIWFSRRYRPLLFASSVLNILMLLGTPLHGSHYLVDMIAGIGVAAASIAFSEALLRRQSQLRATPDTISVLACARS